MRLLWLHQPHPCKACGTIIELAYPTCATDECRRAWRLESKRLASKASRERLSAARLCADCQRHLPKDSKAYRCPSCTQNHAQSMRQRRQDAAFTAYKEKLAFARAQREIEKQEAKRIRERIKEEERVYQEARELADRGWMNEEGQYLGEEI